MATQPSRYNYARESLQDTMLLFLEPLYAYLAWEAG